jgi:hypothetical protein
MDAALFDRYRDAWNNHDVDALLEFFTDDGVYEDVTAARVNRGSGDPRLRRGDVRGLPRFSH